MRSFTPVFLPGQSHTPTLSAQRYVNAFLKDLTITPNTLLGTNANVKANESVSVLYIPEEYFPKGVHVNSFLIEVFDDFQSRFSLGRVPPSMLSVSENKTRVLLGRAAHGSKVISMHPAIVDAARTLARAFMMMLNTHGVYRLSNMEVGQTFVVLVYGPK